MKIAAITEDGKTISHHFGRAPYFLVVTVENNKILNTELREKPGHLHFHKEEHDHRTHSGGHHGVGPVADERHTQMAEAITDCQVVLCRGMGMGAYDSMRSHGIEPIVTDIVEIDQSVEAYLNGEIHNFLDRLH